MTSFQQINAKKDDPGDNYIWFQLVDGREMYIAKSHIVSFEETDGFFTSIIHLVTGETFEVIMSNRVLKYRLTGELDYSI